MVYEPLSVLWKWKTKQALRFLDIIEISLLQPILQVPLLINCKENMFYLDARCISLDTQLEID